MADKSKEVSASIYLVDNKVNFSGSNGEHADISIDYIPPLGSNLGYTSLELLLLSLSSCLGTSVLTFLRKMNRNITKFGIVSKGIRNEIHPTGFKNILLEIHLSSPDVTMTEIEKVVKLSEDTYCPVWSMLKGNTNIEVKSFIE